MSSYWVTVLELLNQAGTGIRSTRSPTLRTARTGSVAQESAINDTQDRTADTSSADDSVTDSPDQLGEGIHVDVLIGSGPTKARLLKRLIE
jgi:hypothetical protein